MSSTVINHQPTEKELTLEGAMRSVFTLTLAAFYGGWLLMLLLGVVGNESGDLRWALGYWTCVPVALGTRLLVGALCRSHRRYALPPPPTVRR